MKFNRTNGVEDLLRKLQSEFLYQNYLSKDNNVFMAFRSNEIHFYYGGSKLFGYTKNGFESHRKFCFNADINKEYIQLNTLNSISPIMDLGKNYKLIKENAKNYAGIEAMGVSDLYKFNFLTQNDFILLDTEIALYDDGSKDRIDLLLFNIKDKELKFVEAKHFSNGELWAKKDSKPEVIKQIGRYNERLEKHSVDILNEYQRYVNLINFYFNLNIPIPETICQDVSLFMFGFDNDQKEKIKRLLKEDDSLEGVNYYFKGDTKNINLETLYKSKMN